jgi:perosamine synthetase
MSVPEPEKPSLGNGAASGFQTKVVSPSINEYVCDSTDCLTAAIEKCLDNGIGSCLVVGGEQRFVGRISLDEIAQAVLDGALLNSSLDQNVATLTDRLRNDLNGTNEVLQPILDSDDRIIGVEVDRAAQHIQVARPNLTHREFRAVLGAFLSTWISSKGPHIEKFEDEFRTFIGASQGIAVSNGTVALHLALVALDVGPGDEVIVPDLTFAATINAVLYCGAVPVIVDVDRETWCLTLEQVERACTSRTKAIIPVHLYGRPAEIGPIAAFCAAKGIFVIEDCAEAHGARYDDRAVGQFGDVACFSFYANKIVTTGEGGMCVTNSPKLGKLIRILRDHGMTPSRSYWHERVGFNYRITNLQAAIGHSQLWRITDTLARNARIAGLYRAALEDIPDVRFPPKLPAVYKPVVWLSCVLVPPNKRDTLLAAALEAKIEMRPFFHSLSSMPPYEKYASDCPNSVALSASGINLPTSHQVDQQVVDRVAKVFRDVLG